MAAEGFETLMEKLEGIVERLESDELSLEEALEAYERGVDLAKQGHARLAEAEKKLAALTASGATVKEIPPEKILGAEEES